jgi:hypothetical protein
VSTVINLFAGPGAGKSTLAAELFFKMKVAGLSCELVREYVKDWAYEGRQIDGFDQFYIVGKQIKKESLLYGKVDFIITDCPIWNSAFYEDHIEGTNYMVNHAKGFTEYAESHDVKYDNYLLVRKTVYDPHGRYQTEEEAKQVDVSMGKFLDRMDLKYQILDVPVDKMADAILKNYI